MENSHLPYLLNEGIYVIKESKPQASEPSVVSEDKEEYKTDKQENTEPELKIQGNADSNLVVINHDSENEFINPQQKGFLQNILKAVKLDLDTIALINNSTKDLSIKELIQHTNAKTVLIFGSSQDVSRDKYPLYNVIEIKNYRLLNADSLDNIEADTEKKKALWACLQQLFLK